jgi:UDPglucose 6-dehydrogenase
MAVHVTVIGTGYLGATQAACLAESGCRVLGVDTDEEKVRALQAGVVPFYEPGLQELVARHVATGALRFTSSFAEAADFGEVHFLCVGTPQRADGLDADLGALYAAVAALVPLLRRQCLVVGKSTVPAGTAERLVPLLAAAPAGGDVDLAWNPEFLREGHAVRDTLLPDRIVAGVRSELAEKVLRGVYAAQLDAGVPFVVTDLATAQLVKVAANAFLATRVSLMNAMADLCEEAGADVLSLVQAVGHDQRIGAHYLHPGLGFGGGCLGKDIRALQAQAHRLGLEPVAGLLARVDEINTARRGQVVRLAGELCGGSVAGRQVGVLGAAFKPDSDDVRDSPALDVAHRLHEAGAVVAVYDPAARANAQHSHPWLRHVGSAVEAAAGADVLLHLTEWEEFRALDPDDLGARVAHRRIVDARNALDADRWRQSGWQFRGLGRPA